MKNLSEERGEEREREGKQGKVGVARESDAARLMVITPLPFGEGLGERLSFPSPYGSPSCSTMALTCRGVKVLFDVW